MKTESIDSLATMRLNLRQLEIFVAIVDEGGFRLAAEALHVSQPTISQEIARLEKALRVNLFDRNRRQATLTPAGAVLLGGARNLLASVNQLITSVSQFESDRLNTVRIVVTPSVENRLLPAVVAAAEHHLPGLVISDTTVETGQVVAHLAERHDDIGVGRFLVDSPGYVRETIAHEPIYIALADHHPLARPDLELGALRDTPLLLWNREQHPVYYDYIMKLCHDRGLDAMVVVGPPRIIGSRQFLLTEGRAFSLVPGSAIDSLPPKVRSLPLTTPAQLPLEMLWRKDDSRPQVIQLLDIVRAQGQLLESLE